MTVRNHAQHFWVRKKKVEREISVGQDQAKKTPRPSKAFSGLV